MWTGRFADRVSFEKHGTLVLPLVAAFLAPLLKKGSFLQAKLYWFVIYSLHTNINSDAKH